VIAPANTRRLNSNNIAVINTDHTNKFRFKYVIPNDLIFMIVVIKFIAPSKLEIPAKCKLNMAISTLGPECAK